MVVMFNDGGGFCLRWKIKIYMLVSLYDWVYYLKIFIIILYLLIKGILLKNLLG